MKEDKLWGVSEEIASNFFRISVEKGGFSSMHYHLKKYNLFYVESGHLRIEFKDRVSQILTSKDKLIIPPGVWHRFQALTEVVAYELYWETPDQSTKEDIIREDQGGISLPL